MVCVGGVLGRRDPLTRISRDPYTTWILCVVFHFLLATFEDRPRNLRLRRRGGEGGSRWRKHGEGVRGGFSDLVAAFDGFSRTAGGIGGGGFRSRSINTFVTTHLDRVASSRLETLRGFSR